MKLSDTSRGQFATTFSDAITFITQMAIPTVEMLRDLIAQGKIIAGGPRAGDIWISVIAEANSALEIDRMFETLPLWPRMETFVSPLTTVDDRITALQNKLAWIKSTHAKELGGSK